MANDDVADRRLQEETWQAERAAQLMADPVMQSILKETERQLLGAIKIAVTPDQAYKAAIALQVFGLIEGAMQSMVDTGKMAAIELERKRNWFGKVTGR